MKLLRPHQNSRPGKRKGGTKKRKGDCVVKVIKYELWPGGGGGGDGGGGGGDESPRRRMGGENMKNGMIQRGWCKE